MTRATWPQVIKEADETHSFLFISTTSWLPFNHDSNELLRPLNDSINCKTLALTRPRRSRLPYPLLCAAPDHQPNTTP